jgi:DNA-binding NarL/FixJ family response regulator
LDDAHAGLQRAGHAVTAVSNGVQGLAAYRSVPTDVVITDLVMPDKEGIQTIMELRNEFPDARVIAISGGGRHVGTDYLQLARRLGARRALAKPFSTQDMPAAVDDLLRG